VTIYKRVSITMHLGKLLSGWWCNNHLEKYEFVNGKDDIPYMMESVPNV
jgi:hypothetical protein